MIPVAEARARIVGHFERLPAETVSLPEAHGRVLANDVAARLDQPPSDLSAMDGYAVRAGDVASTPVTLDVVAWIPAGGSYDQTLEQGQAARIFTGAPLPLGADAIVIQEDTEAPRDGAVGDRVTVREAVSVGRYVRPRGLDFSVGTVGIAAGHVLTARDVGLAAAMNNPWLSVVRKPRIAILATGDEIVLPGDPLGPNQIVSSNAHALGALVSACGGTPVQLGIAPDDSDTLRALAAAAKGADLLLTTGGASVGAHDLVRDALGAEGLELDFWRIAMRPGKPLMFGVLGGTPLLGLPGNPVSALVCALLFLRPAMRRMLGSTEDVDPEITKARLGEPLPENDRREDYLRARLARADDGGLVATPFNRQDSSMLALLAASDCLVRRPPHAPPAGAGDMVDIIAFPGGPGAI